MDSKITKSRLSNLFAYEWILMIVVTVVAIVVTELLYTVLSIRVSVGQNFKVYYDETVYELDNSFYNSFHFGEDSNVFSYDILEFDDETLSSQYNVLSTRLSVYEGDAIVTDIHVDENDLEDKPWNNRANSLIDDYSVYSYDKLLSDCQSYLKKFMKSDEISKDNLDNDKISSYFLTRMKKDNRFRSDKQKESGIEQEKQRIQKLCDEYFYLEKAVEYGEGNGWFYKYCQYTYSFNVATNEDDKALYQDAIGEEKSYGLKLSALNSSSTMSNKVDASTYFHVVETQSADEVVILLFDFYNQQPDLQFESISFINQVIRNCTGYLTINDIPN